MKQKGRNIHHKNKNKNNWTKQETAENEGNMGFKNGMLGKLVSKKQANIHEGKGNKRKTEESKKKKVFPKGGWWQKAKENDGILKGKTQGKQGQKKVEKKDFKDRPFGGTK